ncbi:hypothetical protein ABT272_44705, partial [Streptomyces sp900105245]
LSNGSGFDAPSKWSERMCVEQETCTIGDVNGDRTSDALSLTKGAGRDADTTANGDITVARSLAPTVAPTTKTITLDEFNNHRDVIVSGLGYTPIISRDFALHAGETRLLMGDVEGQLLRNGTESSIDFGVAIRCLIGGKQVSMSAHSDTSLVPGKRDTLHPRLLFRAPASGRYTCTLVGGTSSDMHEWTPVKESTALSWSKADEIGAAFKRNPECDSQGLDPRCTYLVLPFIGHKYILDNGPDGDRSGTLSWGAADDAEALIATANMELTTCYEKSASCRNGDFPGGDASHDSIVTSSVEVLQLDKFRNPCRTFAGPERTDVINEKPHHYNIAYPRFRVPISSSVECGNSRLFDVRINVRLVKGNPVKIDGARDDSEGFQVQTYAYFTNA